MVAIENVNLDDLPTTPDALPVGCRLHAAHKAMLAAGDARLAFARNIDQQRVQRADAQAIVDRAQREPASVEDWRLVAAAEAQVRAIDAWLPGQQARLPEWDARVDEERRRWSGTWASYAALLQHVQSRTATLQQYDEVGRLLGWEPLPTERLAWLEREIEDIRHQHRPVPQAISDREGEIDHMLGALGIDRATYQVHRNRQAPQPVAAGAPVAVAPGW